MQPHSVSLPVIRPANPPNRAPQIVAPQIVARRPIAELVFGVAVTALTLVHGGCASYQFGAAALYPAGIRTVHVPIVRNETFRHELGVQLTEALVAEIERRTPYKVISNPNADSVLRCTLVAQSKVVLTETATDDPRALDSAVSVAVNWNTRDGRRLMQNSLAALDLDPTGFSQSDRFVPEAGQSIDTANQDAINDLARRIVSQMESRW